MMPTITDLGQALIFAIRSKQLEEADLILAALTFHQAAIGFVVRAKPAPAKRR